MTLLSPLQVPRVIEQDADDVVAARAELIVTGDRRRLLPIGNHQGIAILTAQDALAALPSHQP